MTETWLLERRFNVVKMSIKGVRGDYGWCLTVLTAHWDSASTCMVMTARHLYIIFMMSYKEGEKSPDVNVGVLSAASALRECLVFAIGGLLTLPNVEALQA